MLAEDFCKGNAPERSRPFPTAHVEVAYKHWAIPHNSKCRYGERGAADAKPKAQIILDAAKVSAASGGNSEPKQGAAVAECEGLLPPKHDAGTATRHYRAFWQRRCRAAAAGAVLKPSGGNCAVLPWLYRVLLWLFVTVLRRLRGQNNRSYRQWWLYLWPWHR